MLTVVFSQLSYCFFSINWIWILQGVVEAIKEETVVEEVEAAVEAEEMVIGFAQIPGKLYFLCF